MEKIWSGLLPIDRKERLRIPPQPVRKRPVEERIHSFDEVTLGFDAETARREAERCLHCPEPAPCVEACPLHNDIPTALWYIEQGDFLTAAEIYRRTNPMPEICGRVCPPTTCRGSCNVGKPEVPLNTSKLEAFVADYQRRTVGVPLPEKAPPTGKRVAVVGAGPAGLVVAERLTVKGHQVVVYEAMPRPGGLLVYGIPSFKLPKELVMWKAQWLERLGVTFVYNTRIGEDLTVDDLLEREGFDAVFLGTGAEVSAKPRWEGMDLKGVYQSLDFLRRANLSSDFLPPEEQGPPQVGRRVAVIGGGDTAMDCARTAIRLGAQEVTVVYRRTEAEMPGNPYERALAIEEGVRFEFLTAPVRFIGDDAGRLVAMECVRMELGEPDESGRRRPIPIAGSEFTQEVDTVVLALGFWPDPLIGETTSGLKTHRWGLIVADEETGRTSRKEVFAGGDNVHGPDLVVTAMAAGMRAAEAIHDYLMQPSPPEPEAEEAILVPA